MSEKPPDLESLQARLDRLSRAISKPEPSAPSKPPAGARTLEPLRNAGMAIALALLVAGAATENAWLLVAAAVMAILSGALFIRGVGDIVLASLPMGLLACDPTVPHVGMGAEIADGAIIEPGASVEMGASIGKGAIIRRGAIVRMGADVHAGAVLEEGAVVGWGADVHENAVVHRDAVVGAGSTVAAGARVPPKMRLLPGSTWTQTAAPVAASSAPELVAEARPMDARVARVDAACARIESELQLASPQMREMLGASAQSAHALRDTCEQLFAREQLLRAESSDQSLAFLEQEKAELRRRIDAATDPSVRASLESAVASIDDQIRQRKLLRQSADRFDAELTRLSWTLDGMGTQLVRLRSAGQEAATPDAAVLQSMQQLHDEIDAIAGALEHVARDDRAAAPGVSPVVEVGSDAAQRNPDGSRERS